jgi:hypothetical protein
MNKFEATCIDCTRQGRDKQAARIVSRNGGAGWRHDQRPADKHHPRAAGVMKQI